MNSLREGDQHGIAVGIGPQHQAFEQGADQDRRPQGPEHVVPDLVAEMKHPGIPGERALVVAHLVPLPGKGEEPEMEPPRDGQDKDEVAQPDLEHPVEPEGRGPLQRRHEPVPDRDRRQQDEESLRQRTPGLQQVDQALPRLERPFAIGSLGDRQGWREVPGVPGRPSFSGRRHAACGRIDSGHVRLTSCQSVQNLPPYTGKPGPWGLFGMREHCRHIPGLHPAHDQPELPVSCRALASDTPIGCRRMDTNREGRKRTPWRRKRKPVTSHHHEGALEDSQGIFVGSHKSISGPAGIHFRTHCRWVLTQAEHIPAPWQAPVQGIRPDAISHRPENPRRRSWN